MYIFFKLLIGVDHDVYTALPCEEDGTPLLDPDLEAPSTIPRQRSENDWTPYKNRIAF